MTTFTTASDRDLAASDSAGWEHVELGPALAGVAGGTAAGKSGEVGPRALLMRCLHDQIREQFASRGH